MRLVESPYNCSLYKENFFLSVGYTEGIGRVYYRNYKGAYLRKETYSNNDITKNYIFAGINRYHL